MWLCSPLCHNGKVRHTAGKEGLGRPVQEQGRPFVRRPPNPGTTFSGDVPLTLARRTRRSFLFLCGPYLPHPFPSCVCPFFWREMARLFGVESLVRAHLHVVPAGNVPVTFTGTAKCPDDTLKMTMRMMMIRGIRSSNPVRPFHCAQSGLACVTGDVDRGLSIVHRVRVRDAFFGGNN